MTSTLRFDRWETSAGEGIVDGTVASLGRNLLYNGAMQVAQRGTSATGITASGYHTADRWNTILSGLGTWTQTVEADGPTGSGFTKSLKMECTTADGSPAASDQLSVRQYLEGQDLQALKKGTASAESLTLSFWVKSNVTGTYIFSIIDFDNSRLISAPYTVSSSGTWEKKTITLDGDTSGILDNDNLTSLQLLWWLGVGSDRSSGTLQTAWGTDVVANRAVGQTNLAASTSNYWQVTGVQLEAGTVATAFEHKAYGTELAECQRYYQVLVQGDSKTLATVAYYQTDFILGATTFSTKRAAPTLVATAGTDYYRVDRTNGGDFLSSLTGVVPTETTIRFDNNGDGNGLEGQAGVLRTSNANAFVALDSEL